MRPLRLRVEEQSEREVAEAALIGEARRPLQEGRGRGAVGEADDGEHGREGLVCQRVLVG